MRVLDLLGRRWALRVLWELRDGARTFRALREACDDVSPSSLNQRLRELRGLGVIARGDAGYALTRPGVDLSRLLIALSRWAQGALGGARRPRTGAPRRATGAATKPTPATRVAGARVDKRNAGSAARAPRRSSGRASR